MDKNKYYYKLNLMYEDDEFVACVEWIETMNKWLFEFGSKTGIIFTYGWLDNYYRAKKHVEDTVEHYNENFGFNIILGW